MSKQTKPPGSAFEKSDGAWTFHIEVDGRTLEAGDYPDAMTATLVVDTFSRLYEANKDENDNIGVIV
jgi:hypothetical protein